MILTKRIYYVYEHWRPDTNRPFYVGKGKGKRAHNPRRNPYWRNVVEKLKRDGLRPLVKFVVIGLSEKEALALECKRVAMWRRRGVSLTNITDGGQGTSGWSPSPETRAKISKANAERSPEVKARVSAAVTAANLLRIEETRAMGLANRGKKLSSETRAKMSASRRGGKRSPDAIAKTAAFWSGRKHTPDAIAKMKEAARLRIEETRAMGLANRGRKHTPEARIKMSQAQLQVAPDVVARRIAILDEARKNRSSEAMEKTAEFHRGRKRSPETCAKMVEAWKRRRGASS